MARRVVDFVSASPYFRRLAAESTIRIVAETRVLSEFKYEFSVSLFAFFECALRELLANPPVDAQTMNPADLIAQAVYRTA